MNDTFYPLYTDDLNANVLVRSHLIQALRKALKFRAESGKESPHFYALMAGLSDEAQYQLMSELPAHAPLHIGDDEMTVDRELLGFQTIRVPQLGGYEVTVKLTATVSIRKRG
jgi:hypothetical protein